MGTKAVDAIYELGISHNKFGTPLPDGTFYPEHAVSVTGSRGLEFLQHFNRVRDRHWADCSFLDLGCSEGSTTFEISQMGSTVYGVEGRGDAVRRAQTIKDIIGFEKTHFSVGNVNDVEIYRDVEGIFNAGVLYHLEDPVTCLDRCAKHARLFVYLDTGHMPRDEHELKGSKFAYNFGEAYKLNYKGLELNAIDFAEPGDPSETHAQGVRRGPRSGIGNSNSVWLSHESVVRLMALLGFPYHQVVREQPIIPRLRTCFFRTEPAPAKKIDQLLKPLPQPLPPHQMAQRLRERDADYLRRRGEAVLLLGAEPMLSEVRHDLNEVGIEVSKEIVLPTGRPVTKRRVIEAMKEKRGLVVVATQDQTNIVPALMLLDRFDYAFTSFAMAKSP